MEVQLKKRIVSENELTMQVIRTKELKVAAYARVSTEHDDQRLSLDSQQKYYLNKIKETPNWNLVGIYVDDGISATGVNRRKGFQSLMRDAGKGKIDLILTKSVSRFARNTLDTLNFVRKLKDIGVAVYFEEENINTLDMNGELLLTILSSVAQQESLNLSSHVNLGLKIKMQKGEPCGTVKCYGYDFNRETGELTINKEQAEIIKLMAKWYIEGDGTCTIAKKLTKMGIPSPKGNKIWNEGSVTHLLKNEKLKGDILLGKYYTPNPLNHKRISNKGVKDKYYVKGHHEPIISEEDWNNIQDIMAQREKERKHKSPITSQNRYSTSGAMKCGFCGNSLHRLLTNTVKDPKYYCMLNKSAITENCEESRMISELIIQRIFMQTMNRLRNKIKLEHRFSDKVNERINHVRKILLNKDDIDIESFDEDLFRKTVLFYVLGGYDENKKVQPYMIRIIIKTEHNEICDIYPDYKEYVKNEFYTILDYYSNQTFHFYVKDKKGNLKQKYVNRLRVQVQFAIEDNNGTENN